MTPVRTSIDDLVGQTATEEMIKQLSPLMLIEVGRIIGWAQSTGKAVVRSYDTTTGTESDYTDVEVLWPGCEANGFRSDPTGSACLVFAPRTTVPSLHENLINTGAPNYSKGGIKCMPVYLGHNNNLVCGFDGGGTLSAATQLYSIQLGEKHVTFSWNGGSVLVDYDAEYISRHTHEYVLETLYGKQETVHYSKIGRMIERRFYDDSGVATVQRLAMKAVEKDQLDDLSSYENWQWVDTFATDGTKTTTLSDADNQPLVTITTTPEGDINLTNQGGTTIDVKIDGSVAITTGAAVTFTAGDAVTIDASSGISISGNTSITGNVSINGELSNTKKASLANGNLTADA